MISIIIPVYNTEKYLRRCLDSIVAQTYKDFECLLVDDGSTDCSGKICDEYATKDQRFVAYHTKNYGVGHARNVGLENVSGKYLSFVDSDDWLNPDFYEMLLSEIKSHDLVYVSDIWHYTDDSIVKHQLPKKESCSREKVEKMILYLKKNEAEYPFFGYTWNKLFRTDIIKEHNIKFVENLTLCEDEVFTDAYCRYINSMSFVPETLYNYRAGMSGLTGRKKTNSEYMLLIRGIEQNAIYANSSLVDYEHNRMCELLQNALTGGGIKSNFFRS